MLVLSDTGLWFVQWVRWPLLLRARSNYLAAGQVDFCSGANATGTAMCCNVGYLQALKKAALACDGELQHSPDFLSCVYTGAIRSEELSPLISSPYS